MKRQIITATAIALLATSIIFSCKKKEATAPDPASTSSTTGGTTGGTITAPAGGFAWTENGGATINADSAYWTTWASGTGVRAYKGGMANYFEINWGTTQNNTAVGAKPLALSDLTFLKGSATYTNNATSNLNVTAFASNQLSGNFTVSVSGGSITNIIGTFNAIQKK
jgi:hypothetical protein